MELLESRYIKLPKVIFIDDRENIKDIPIGLPFILGEKKDKKNIIRILEYEAIYKSALETGLPFDFKKLLKKAGFKGLKDFGYQITAYLEYKTEKDISEYGGKECSITSELGEKKFNDFMNDTAVYVDISILKGLKIFPMWLEDVEEAVTENIYNFAAINPYMYNKKLDGMYGGVELSSPIKNLIVIDISGSIPKGASSVTLSLAKTFAATFYADLMITGSKTTLYPFEDVPSLDIENMYEENGMGNDQVCFKNIVTKDERKYGTAVVFGDNHSPCYPWYNSYNKNTSEISREDGKKMCKWEVDKIVSLHTTDHSKIAGYGEWFNSSNVTHIKDWVKYM